ncbi:hypothetical protein MAP00_004055 [Monascus purpureus]|nr:hypothetical protein MAP00_004055 [Monascus purpureus]
MGLLLQEFEPTHALDKNGISTNIWMKKLQYRRSAEVDTGEEKEATTFLADIRFHRSLWLPPDPRQGRFDALRVTYSDLGCEDGPAIIWCGGLFGSRYTLAESDELAKQKGVRVISPDKPGIGGTMGVEIEDKVKTWLGLFIHQTLRSQWNILFTDGMNNGLDIVQAILKTLSITHISLIGHSSGVIYSLDPSRALEDPDLRHGQPAAEPSDQLLVRCKLYHLPLYVSHARTQHGSTGLDSKTEHSRAVSEKILVYALKENVSGIAQEAQFCLKRGDDGIWGEIKSYEQFVHLLKEREQGYQQKQQSQGKHDVNKLNVDTFFAESDQTSGRHGGKYFDNAWRKVFQGDDRVDDECVVYGSSMVPGTTHETIMRPESGVLGYIFEKVKRARSPSSAPHPQPYR